MWMAGKQYYTIVKQKNSNKNMSMELLHKHTSEIKKIKI